ncbi:bifunctional DNA primase/polymerase [Kitasatospora sp. NPDC057223]|uniref:bifunctional DNA primase/polymerase n=1 Tax=Kitasatospora sp. NPDC057223 TaxID=3346055 RepID=UPI003639DC09
MHPLIPGGKTPPGNCVDCQQPGHRPAACPCRKAGRWCHGFHAASTDSSLIERWWGANAALGVAVACGPAGLVVIDIDAHDDPVPARDRVLPGIAIHDGVDLTGLANGYHTLALLAALRGQPDPAADESTLRVRTPAGGLHLWYRAPAGRKFLCSSGSSTGRALAWQVDIRAHGGYIIAPGTATAAGVYEPVSGPREPALLPDWLAHELGRTGHDEALAAARPAAREMPARGRQAVLAAGGGRTAADRLLLTALSEVTACQLLAQGAGFSDKLNRAAFTAGGLTAAGYLAEAEAQRMLTEAAAAARPGQERRAAQIIRSGLAAGARRPLHPEGRP